MTLVAGIDSSTQSCKVVIRDAETGALHREGRASHPEGTSVDPNAWWDALSHALHEAGGLADVDAISVAGQQHGMVTMDADAHLVRDALLWNDTRSGQAAADLVTELGAKTWAEAIGTVPVASLTVTKLRWLRENEPENAEKVAAVSLPHDWLSWRLVGNDVGNADFASLATDRSDASGTGYWSPFTNQYRPDLLEHAFGAQPVLPRVLKPTEVSGTVSQDLGGRAIVAAGAGDNAGGALGLGAAPGDVVVSIGTSGTVFAVTNQPTADQSGTVAGFADAAGAYLPLVATLNASRVLDAAARMLDVDHHELSRLALSVPAGSDGLTLVPYFEGERTPNKPDATGTLHGMRLANTTPAHLARAAFEGVLCGLADGLDALVRLGVSVERISLIGGGAQSEALRKIAPTILGLPVVVPPPGEYVADGAARQAAWALAAQSSPGAAAPTWRREGTQTYEATPAPHVREQYAAVQDLV